MVFSEKLAESYQKLKTEASDMILVMQVGAFMQVMSEDAKILSKVCGLKLNMAGDVATPVVIGGFPKSGLDQYVGKMVRAGHSMAIAMQDENKNRRIVEMIRISGT